MSKISNIKAISETFDCNLDEAEFVQKNASLICVKTLDIFSGFMLEGLKKAQQLMHLADEHNQMVGKVEIMVHLLNELDLISKEVTQTLLKTYRESKVAN